MSIDPADRFYEAIRQDTDDVKLIAQHTGWKVTSIEKLSCTYSCRRITLTPTKT